MPGFWTQGANTTNKFAVLVKKSCSPQWATRILILLWIDDGKTSPESSNFLGGSYSTAAYLCAHGDSANRESLRDWCEKGNYTKVTHQYIDLLMPNLWSFLSANRRIWVPGRSYKSKQRLPRQKSFLRKIKGFRLRPKNCLDAWKSTKYIEKYKVNFLLSSKYERIL